MSNDRPTPGLQRTLRVVAVVAANSLARHAAGAQDSIAARRAHADSVFRQTYALGAATKIGSASAMGRSRSRTL
ncbi:MAG: hypothetical protein ACHQWU_08160 [Gemmatimonadales bacterium]